jgi:DNA invertase Pin-like site-specific DNA recombinase
MIFGIMLTMAQVEREMNKARTRSAIETMKANGVKICRDPYSSLNEHENKIKRDFKTMTIRELAKKYDVRHDIMCHYLERRNYFGGTNKTNNIIGTVKKTRKDTIPSKIKIKHMKKKWKKKIE